MKATSLLLASSLALLCAGIGCDDDVSDGDGRPGGTGGVGGSAGGGGVAGSGGSAGSGDRDAEAPIEPDASTDGGSPTACQLIDQAFEAFLAANRGCDEDADCRIIGDCEPNVDWRAINESAADQGYSLMAARCGDRGADGPTYAARCDDGVCALGEENGVCGDLDAGVDEPDASNPGDAAVGDGG
jgi:hypothetical protein